MAFNAQKRQELPLVLGVKRRLSRRNDPQAIKAQTEFERQRLAILKRDHWTCRGAGCGFAAHKMDRAPAGGMEVHHINDDHHDNRPENLITLCPLCHMVFMAGRRGAHFSGSLGWLPGLHQGQINLLHHVVWGVNRALEILAKQPDRAAQWGHRTHEPVPDGVQKAWREALDQLQLLANQSQERLYDLMDNALPHVTEEQTLYAMLQSLPHEAYRRRQVVFRHVRLWPNYEAFADLVDLWAEQIWVARYPVSSWDGVVDTVRRELERLAQANTN